MLTHEQIWQSIDKLARDHGYSPSGLARKAGLDPTAFNKSKRISADGKPRWPSTESVAKILAATGSNMTDFLNLEEEVRESVRLQPGDRVAVQRRNGEVLNGTLARQSAASVAIRLTGSQARTQEINREDIAWLAQIVYP